MKTESPNQLEYAGGNLLFASAVRLLKHGERMPLSVYEIMRYCCKKNVPVTFSRNEPAGSCLDASRKRARSNGHVGIPLRDEMKTLVGAFWDSEKKRHTIAVHCRGDRSIDFKKVKRLLPESIIGKSRVSLLDERSLLKMYGMRFGIVNPVLLDIRSGGRLLQIFDAGLLEGSPPYRMMTNAGEYTWGMEFDAEKMISAVDAHIVDFICR